MKKEQNDIISSLYQPTNESKRLPPEWKSLVGGFLVEFVMGTFTLWGIVGPYIASYLRLSSDTITIKEASVIYPIIAVSASFARIISKKVVDRIGFNIALRGSLIIMSASLGVASFIDSFVPFVFLFAVIPGIMGGIGTILPVWAAWEAIPRRRGLASGLTTAGFGFGSFLLGLISQFVANPENLQADIVGPDGQNYFDYHVANRVPWLLRVLSGFVLVFGLGGSCFVSDPLKQRVPADYYLSFPPSDEDSTKGDNDVKLQSTGNVHPVDIKFRQAIKTKNVWILAVLTLLMTIPLNFVASTFKFYAENKPNLNNDVYLTTLAALGSVLSCFTKIGWGHWNDLTSFRFTFGLLILIEAISLSLLALLAESSKMLYLVIIDLILICFGGVYVLLPTICSKIYGNKTGTQIYGVIDSFMSFGSVVQYFCLSIFLDILNFDCLLYVMAALAAASLLFHVFFFTEKL